MNERIHQKIERLKEHLALLHTLRSDCEERFPTDPIYRGAVLHYLYQLADGCIVLAELIIKLKKFRTPQTYAEAFDILGERGILSAEFAFSFAAIAGFRNFLAHDYEKIDGMVDFMEVLGRFRGSPFQYGSKEVRQSYQVSIDFFEAMWLCTRGSCGHTSVTPF